MAPEDLGTQAGDWKQHIFQERISGRNRDRPAGKKKMDLCSALPPEQQKFGISRPDSRPGEGASGGKTSEQNMKCPGSQDMGRGGSFPKRRIQRNRCKNKTRIIRLPENGTRPPAENGRKARPWKQGISLRSGPQKDGPESP